ncbi:DUF3422 domain-containing protein [Novosphingobium sp. LASN5T]|uniref:DUF3422 domain-containing protein n=1 Tax=Novosphingobium sp. LASN5T TaxID=2491021 RepID=UPI000F5F4281|nr:DUF3422 domain-containing protein [Novosphingobium sp. LASN5T]RQW46107.1 DUF3422 family protein [Novosphingobium sp. LASN5T]
MLPPPQCFEEATLGWVEHPQRRQIVNEMHLRRWPELPVPCELIQILRMVDDDERTSQSDALEALPAAALEPRDNPRQTAGMLCGGVQFVHECYSEASATTLILPFEKICETGSIDSAVLWAENLPGRVIRATRILICATVEEAEQHLPRLKFKASDLVSCHVGAEGKVRLWSDFRIGEDGWGRLLISANGAETSDLTRLVQRLQELGNYRNLALLGLPVAQQHWGNLDRAELELSALAVEVALPESIDDVLLRKVTAVSLELIHTGAATRFRMGATQAYSRIAWDRLHEIGNVAVPGHSSLLDFTERRLRPAVRTCDSFVHRLSELTFSADRFAALLRTRIETRIENQNALLLKSMRSISMAQLRTQHFVEGFSIIAISYYTVGLLGHFMSGLEFFWGHRIVGILESSSVPVSLLLLAVVVVKTRRRLTRLGRVDKGLQP